MESPTNNSIDWSGPDDPDCPYNWPMWRRIYVASIPAFLYFDSYWSFASSVYTSGAEDISEKFGVSHTASLLGLSLFLWALGFVYPFYFISPFIGAAFGPVIGGFVSEAKDFRWLEWVETYKKTILQKRLRAETRSDAAQSHSLPVALPSSAVIQRIVLKPFKMLFVESIVLFLTIYMAFSFAVFYSFFAAFPYVFGDHYDFTPNQQGLTFISMALGCVIGFLAIVYIDWRTYPALEAKYGVGAVPPEYRLYGAMVGCALNPVSLFWFGWTSDAGVYWPCSVVAAVPFAVGNIMVYSSGALYIMNSYGSLHGASALSANSLLRYAGGGAFPLFTVQMFSSLGIGWASSLLGLVSVALVPVPWVLYKYGERIRARSQYITIKQPVLGDQNSLGQMTSGGTRVSR
ncbi:major facilitator superfamily domain-containing protein [Calycina marina]|uniref:Major facilitator superfamily domain-containing protein n=1 Tax=Calycina marina TaxID=1763456 RepID=A0A9P7YVK6_9HELO|nr:major facilitator superfamily domain-containing protein [Calycina marina]